VKGQGKLNTHIIINGVLMQFTKNYQNYSMLVETTAYQICRVFQTQCSLHNVIPAMYI